MTEAIKVELQGRTTILTIDRPHAMNALTTAAHIELDAAISAFEADADQWVAVITGTGGRAFCAGHDLKQQAEGGGLVLPPSGFGGLTSRPSLKKPIIAAVEGVAFGGGFEIALACDLIIAGRDAQFALPEPRVGLVALAGGMHRLPREIGLKRAMGMMLTGRRVGATEGFELGFVNEVVDAGNALIAALRWADTILEASPVAVRTTKAVVLRGLAGDLQDILSTQDANPDIVEMWASADAAEGPTAFKEKRRPIWSGQ